METIIFSNHALEQMKARNISVELVNSIITNPQQVIIEPGKKIFQSIVNFKEEGEYLVRIFVNSIKNPNVIITVYRTSKLDKYYES